MTDNQQQQMNVENKRPVGKTLVLVGGIAVIALLTAWASHWAVPEVYGDTNVLRPPS